MEESSLTEASLISLREHCKHLETCYISADLFFEELVRKGRPNLFPVLDEMYITQPVSDRREYKDIQQTVKPLLLVFPKLEALKNQGSVELSELDEDFGFAAHDAIYTRNRWFRGLEDSPEDGPYGLGCRLGIGGKTGALVCPRSWLWRVASGT